MFESVSAEQQHWLRVPLHLLESHSAGTDVIVCVCVRSGPEDPSLAVPFGVDPLVRGGEDHSFLHEGQKRVQPLQLLTRRQRRRGLRQVDGRESVLQDRGRRRHQGRRQILNSYIFTLDVASEDFLSQIKDRDVEGILNWRRDGTV